MPGRAWLVEALAVGMAAACAVSAQETGRPIDDPSVARAWQALRTVNCERCHGPHHTGLSAPSIVDYARTQERAAFVRMVLDGDPARGMPGYRGNPLVTGNIEGIYRYFAGRADRSIGPGERPASPPP